MTEILERAYWLDDPTPLSVEELGTFDEWGLDYYPMERLEEAFGVFDPVGWTKEKIGLGPKSKMQPKEATRVEQSLDDKFNQLRAAWPKDRKVSGESMLAVLKVIEPLAKKIAALPRGKKYEVRFSLFAKSSYEISDADLAAANGLLYEINERLPKQYLGKNLEPWLLSQIKAKFMQIALTGPYVEGTSWFDIFVDESVRYMQAVKEAVEDLPQTLKKYGWDWLPLWAKISLGVVGVGAIYMVLSGVRMRVAGRVAGLQALPRRRYLPPRRRRYR